MGMRARIQTFASSSRTCARRSSATPITQSTFAPRPGSDTGSAALNPFSTWPAVFAVSLRARSVSQQLLHTRSVIKSGGDLLGKSAAAGRVWRPCPSLGPGPWDPATLGRARRRTRCRQRNYEQGGHVGWRPLRGHEYRPGLAGHVRKREGTQNRWARTAATAGPGGEGALAHPLATSIIDAGGSSRKGG